MPEQAYSIAMHLASSQSVTHHPTSITIIINHFRMFIVSGSIEYSYHHSHNTLIKVIIFFVGIDVCYFADRPKKRRILYPLILMYLRYRSMEHQNLLILYHFDVQITNLVIAKCLLNQNYGNMYLQMIVTLRQQLIDPDCMHVVATPTPRGIAVLHN